MSEAKNIVFRTHVLLFRDLISASFFLFLTNSSDKTQCSDSCLGNPCNSGALECGILHDRHLSTLTARVNRADSNGVSDLSKLTFGLIARLGSQPFAICSSKIPSDFAINALHQLAIAHPAPDGTLSTTLIPALNPSIWSSF